ncbi:hypothetical protein HPP92_007115 [Vanilla planifolia]|uniref:Uncharacterized protein n=1 Tax=Vanilla planifolia TaxID=51239 RepID=A0A835V5K8_VANPL|nr:hypothetical protein HPP92_007115 [Vanilla planifolia]
MGWWGEGHQKILGGRDLIAGGTWMACTRDGRLAFLTNVLEPEPIPEAKTRGDLPVRFLESTKSPMEFAEEIIKEADDYNGFNLIIADLCLKIMIYISNRPKIAPITVQIVSPGLHVLTNAQLDTPWPKAQRLGKIFMEFLRQHEEEEVYEKEMVETMMKDTVRAELDRLPKTGCDVEWEQKLSSIFIDVKTKMGTYGTRSTSILSVKTTGQVSFYESYLEDKQWKEHAMCYKLRY